MSQELPLQLDDDEEPQELPLQLDDLDESQELPLQLDVCFDIAAVEVADMYVLYVLLLPYIMPHCDLH